MTTIVTKNGSGAPLASDLVQGELAVDLTNKRLYTEDSGGSVIEIGTSPSTVDINAGTIDGTVIGGSSAAAGTFTTFTSTGIDDNATSTAITIDSSQNVGIGTASPAHPLEVNGIAKVNTYLSMNNNGYIRGDASGELRFQGGSTATTFYDSTNIAERMRIDSSGNVGIGTTSPFSTARLQVNTGTNLNLAVQTGTTETSGMKINAFNDAATANIPLELNGSVTLLKTGETERMRIDSSGNLLVGTTSPINSHTIRNTSLVPLSVYRDNGGSANSIAVFYSDFGSTQRTHCSIRGDGDLENTNNSYGALSDERLKSNIVDASSQIDDIMAVQVRSYTLDSTGATHIGVVAQELEASGMSGLVKTDDEGMKSVKYSVLYMKAIKALQEAVTRIETLEAEVAALKGA